jgi:hypothetical protein
MNSRMASGKPAVAPGLLALGKPAVAPRGRTVGATQRYWISTHLMIFTPLNVPPAFLTDSTSKGHSARL